MQRRDFLKGTSAAALGVGILPFLKALPASAQTSGDTLVVVTGTTINSLDLHRTGTNRPSYQVAVNCYDRLVGFGIKTLPDGTLSYDYDTLVPELAERWEIAPDGMSVTFYLREDATFWDGTPVTAEDVKWSLDRALLVGGFPTVQMRAGGMEKPEQFEVVAEKVVRVHYLQPSKLLLPDLAVPVPFIINSKVAKANATAEDPWAMEYLHRTPAGSGAYQVERWDPGQQLVYVRNDQWKGGPVPAIRRVIIREIPSQATRRALIERGSVQFSHDIPAKDAREMLANPRVNVVGHPIENCLHVLCPNLKFAPFQDKRVRQAIAYAIPYAEIYQNAAYERGARMWGGESFTPESIHWPQPFPYTTDYDKARDLLAQTDFRDGFEVPLSFDLGTAEWGEPAALLIQEGLQRIGIRTTIDRIPGANWRTVALVEKNLPLHLENFGGWLNTPCYYFFWAYVSNRLFNSSNYADAEMDQLLAETLHISMDDPDYAPKMQRMIAKAFDEVPRIPLYQPSLEVAMAPAVQGYQFWFHRMPDVRTMRL
jgi:peptide/nickel transport system substrate-binding protein